jgi:hypothetical protein
MDPIVVRAFPRMDDIFIRTVDQVARELAPDDPSTLEAALRLAYPGVRVTAQSPLAHLGEATIWYVFRDGRARTVRTANAEP